MPGTITSIETQKKNPDRANIYVEGKFAFGLAKHVAASLTVGEKLDEGEIAELQFQDQKKRRTEQAMRLIRRRPRSRKELDDYFKKKGVQDSMRTAILDHLVERDYVNDRHFAQAWIENRSAFRPRGERALRFELKNKGIDREIIDEALDGFDEQGAAQAAASMAWRKYKHLSEEEYKRKALPYMARRGFNYALGARAIKRVRQERLLEGDEREDSR